jgi:hypothetical protein
MQFSDEFLGKWEHLISEVSVTEVPLECIKKIIIKFSGRRQKTININTMRKQGLTSGEIEVVLTRALNDIEHEIEDMDWVIDAAAVAEIVQPETDKLLDKLR